MINKQSILNKLNQDKDKVKDPAIKKDIENKIDKLSNDKPINK